MKFQPVTLVASAFAFAALGACGESEQEAQEDLVEQQYEYLPESAQIGEPVDQAFMSNSNLMQALRQHSPANTTVTIWIFSDSFNEFRRLKKALFDLGFAAAGRPLPPGGDRGA